MPVVRRKEIIKGFSMTKNQKPDAFEADVHYAQEAPSEAHSLWVDEKLLSSICVLENKLYNCIQQR